MLLYQGWVVDAIEVLMIAFVLEDIAETFGLDSVSKGLIGSASFFGESAAEDKRGRVCRIFSRSTAQRTWRESASLPCGAVRQGLRCSGVPLTMLERYTKANDYTLVAV